MRIGLIGFGAIGSDLATRLARDLASGVQLVGVLLRPGSSSTNAAAAAGLTVVHEAQQLAQLGVSWVIECAGHAALQRHGPDVLRSGMHLLVASVGALADPALESTLAAACQKGAQVLLPSGALGGLDALAGARHAGDLDVTYISEKPVAAWRATPAETMTALDQVQGTVTFFEGSAREAALHFPQNANVAAAVGFAGVGLDKTRVQLRAVQGQTVNRHRVLAHGAFGQMEFMIEGRPLPSNPKTSILAATSLLEATLNQSRTIRLA